MGYWVDLDDAYRTMDSGLHRVGVVVAQADLRQGPAGRGLPRGAVVPALTRPALSDHELAQGYENVVDPSVYVRFPLTSGPLAGRASLLVWTTTPWTLVSNTAVAVHPDVTYVVATDGTEQLVVAEPLLEQALGDGWTADRRDVHRQGAGALDRTGVRSIWSRSPGAHFVDPRRLRDHRQRHRASCTRRRRSAPTTSPPAARTGCRWSTRCGRTARSSRSCRWSAACSSRTPTRRWSHDLRRARAAVPPRQPYEHSYPHCWRCHTR